MHTLLSQCWHIPYGLCLGNRLSNAAGFFSRRRVVLQPQILMLANIVLEIGIGVAGLLLGGVGGWLFLRATAGGTIRLARREAEQLITAAKTEGDAEKQKIELEKFIS